MTEAVVTGLLRTLYLDLHSQPPNPQVSVCTEAGGMRGGALDGGVPMSHVRFKKMPNSHVPLVYSCPCHMLNFGEKKKKKEARSHICFFLNPVAC